ncbi:MAG TPA: cation:proton antiporter [Nakamurella sp.]|nr:cation:proton antiporter [Nakamurella sp.]
MTAAAVVFAVLVLAFAAAARGLGRVYVTAPIAFVIAGAVISAVAPVPVADMAVQVRAVAEVTLALILFHDAAQVRPRQIEGDRGLVVRLLLVGLPLTVVAGFMGARLVFPAMPVMVGLLLAAALAPTDAGLGAATVLNPVVPVRVRRILNVESGLNDGLITPVVLFAIAAVAGEEDLRTGASVVQGLVDLAVGAMMGAAVGAGGGLLLGWSRRRDLSTKSTRSLGVLVLPILAYSLVALVGANSFVACFIAGTAFTAAASWVDDEESALDRTEGLSELLGFAVWLVFGLAVLPLIRVQIGWQELLFAVLSLTVFRMVPVAVSLIGTGMQAWSIAFIGWFGPRGLASVVFALLAIEDLDVDDALRTAIATLAMTVLLSVILHGLTADVLAARYGAWIDRTRPPTETAAATEPRPRRSLVPWHHRPS